MRGAVRRAREHGAVPVVQHLHQRVPAARQPVPQVGEPRQVQRGDHHPGAGLRRADRNGDEHRRPARHPAHGQVAQHGARAAGRHRLLEIGTVPGLQAGGAGPAAAGNDPVRARDGDGVYPGMVGRHLPQQLVAAALPHVAHDADPPQHAQQIDRLLQGVVLLLRRQPRELHCLLPGRLHHAAAVGHGGQQQHRQHRPGRHQHQQRQPGPQRARQQAGQALQGGEARRHGNPPAPGREAGPLQGDRVRFPLG